MNRMPPVFFPCCWRRPKCFRNAALEELILMNSYARRFVFLLLAVFLAFPLQRPQAETLPDAALEELVRTSKIDASRTLGYPGNQNIALNEFYEWYTKSGLCSILLNNAGDPFAAHGALNALDIERKVVEFFAPLYGFEKETVWGLVTASGTDGNNHGIYFGAKLLKNETGQEPILYVSKESHYSNKRLADLQNIECRLIDCDKMGRMLPSALKRALEPSRPALIIYSIGTTFKGAIDDIPALNAVLAEVKPAAVYRHVDAALFGGYLPFTPYKDIVNSQKRRFDSIAVSGHKFFGMDEPCGLFLTKKDVLEKQTSFNIAYLNANMPMINCSRSALNPLKLYWITRKTGIENFTAQAERILAGAAYLKEKLDAIGWPAWLGDKSNTVFFRRPSEAIMQKYSLAPEEDERFGGKLAHVVIMQHIDREALDAFLTDMRKEAGRYLLRNRADGAGEPLFAIDEGLRPAGRPDK